MKLRHRQAYAGAGASNAIKPDEYGSILPGRLQPSRQDAAAQKMVVHAVYGTISYGAAYAACRGRRFAWENGYLPFCDTEPTRFDGFGRGKNARRWGAEGIWALGQLNPAGLPAAGLLGPALYFWGFYIAAGPAASPFHGGRVEHKRVPWYAGPGRWHTLRWRAWRAWDRNPVPVLADSPNPGQIPPAPLPPSRKNLGVTT